jgi:hypothetical protein
MQPAIKAELTSTSEGHPLLVLRGEEGAVSVEGWRDPDSGLVVGMLTVHSPVPHAARRAPEECEFLGRCHPVFADWTTNFTAAEYLVRGGRYIRMAEVVASAWYLTYLCPQGALS